MNFKQRIGYTWWFTNSDNYFFHCNPLDLPLTSCLIREKEEEGEEKEEEKEEE